MSATPRDTVFGFSTPLAKGAALVLLVAGVTVLVFSVPEEGAGRHGSRSLVQKIYILPLMLSAAWFGLRGALATTVAITFVGLGMIVSSGPGDAGLQVERMGEIGVFWLVGALAANFFEQQKKYVEDLEGANENTLLALASALDVREENTGLHSHRVAEYTLRLAREVGIGDHLKLSTIWKGALLHDLGKIGVPDSILLKPGALSPEEWEVMRRHTEVGNTMLGGISFLQRAAEIVLYHHEWFDGTGYPYGLKGKEIPLGARIFAVIDVYDAVTTSRVYRSPVSHDKAAELIRKKSGTHFDPEIVDAFGRIPFAEWEEIAGKNKTTLLRETAA